MTPKPCTNDAEKRRSRRGQVGVVLAAGPARIRLSERGRDRAAEARGRHDVRRKALTSTDDAWSPELSKLTVRVRNRIRQRSVLGPLWRAAVFAVGLLCILTGVVPTVLPGPRTLPPILLGLYVWSTEFPWARRLFGVFRTKARRAWGHARRAPASTRRDHRQRSARGSRGHVVGGALPSRRPGRRTVHFLIRADMTT
ncbi:PGPGW domain-containing protein [Blastococcus sp. SYSU DS0510]